MKLITLGDNMMNRMSDYINERMNRCTEAEINSDDLRKFLIEVQKQIFIFQLFLTIGAYLKNLHSNVNSFKNNTRFITKNIFIQTTYYKTLTSRP